MLLFPITVLHPSILKPPASTSPLIFDSTATFQVSSSAATTMSSPFFLPYDPWRGAPLTRTHCSPLPPPTITFQRRRRLNLVPPFVRRSGRLSSNSFSIEERINKAAQRCALGSPLARNSQESVAVAQMGSLAMLKPSFTTFDSETIALLSTQFGYKLPEDPHDTIFHLRALEVSRTLH